jgi:hypothetical protein
MTHLFLKCLFLLFSPLSLAPSILAETPPKAPIYVNAGGPEFVDSVGTVWQSDEAYVSTTAFTTTTERAILNTSNPALFQTSRVDATHSLTFEIPCQNGEYLVLLYFCEIRSRQQERVFDVLLERTTVLSNFNIFHEAGNATFTAVVQRTAAVVTDGSLTLTFRRVQSNPIISGIEIHNLPPQEQRRVRLLQTTTTTLNRWMDMNESETYTGRHECSFVQVGNLWFLFGGRESPKRLEAYDYTLNSWSTKSPPPQPFHHFQALQYEGLLWVIGSFRHNGFPREEPADRVHVYDAAKDAWMVGPRIPRPRGGGGLAVYNDKFYLVGGNTYGHSGGFVNWLDEYNPTTGEWKSLQDAPHARDHFHAAVVGDRLYAAGGRRTHANDWFSDTVPEVNVYDFTQNEWLVVEDTPDDLPIPRAGTTTAVFDGKVVVIGGESGIQQEAHNEVHALNVSSGTWETLAPLNHGRHGMQAIVSGKGIFVAAGSPQRGGGNQQNMEVYRENAPEGEASVAGSLTSSVVSIAQGQEGVVTIRHDNTGNQGVFVTSLHISGQHANELEIVQDKSPFLVPHGKSVDILVRNVGYVSNTKAWLNVIHSGSEWLRIPLGGQGSISSSSTSSLVLTPAPTPIASSMDDNLVIQRLMLVNAATNLDILPLHQCNACVTSDTYLTIRAEVTDETFIQEVHLSISSTVTEFHTQVERSPPFALFGGDYQGFFHVGRTLGVGDYTVTAHAISVSGEEGPIVTETLSILS